MDAVETVAQAQWLENYGPPPNSLLTWDRLPEDVRGLFLSGASEVVAAISFAQASAAGEDLVKVAARALAAARVFGAPWDLLSDATKVSLRGRVSVGLCALTAVGAQVADLPAA